MLAKLTIDTEKNIFLLDGKPLSNCSEIKIHITPDGVPMATITMAVDLNINFH